jgi:hypothetical protein
MAIFHKEAFPQAGSVAPFGARSGSDPGATPVLNAAEPDQPACYLVTTTQGEQSLIARWSEGASGTVGNNGVYVLVLADHAPAMRLEHRQSFAGLVSSKLTLSAKLAPLLPTPRRGWRASTISKITTHVRLGKHRKFSRIVRVRAGPQCAALAANSEGSSTRPLSITFAIPA